MVKPKQLLIRFLIFALLLGLFYLIVGKETFQNIYYLPFIIYTLLCAIYDAYANSSTHSRHIFSDDMDIDEMDGTEFEQWCAELLKKKGFTNVFVTQASKDQGADILAEMDGRTYAIQCKRYGKPVGNKAVQEAIASREYYQADLGMVITNNYFTTNAIDLANTTDVILWDREDILN